MGYCVCEREKERARESVTLKFVTPCAALCIEKAMFNVLCNVCVYMRIMVCVCVCVQERVS